VNDFIDNGAGTITDQATGLMWTQDDSETGLNWEEALSWVAQKNTDSYLGYDDWRLPNAKELQCIVDYTRSPETTNSAAIDSQFFCSIITDEGGGENYPFYWTGTTHANMQVNGKYAVYISFGESLGWMEMPPNSGNFQLLDVHGAGAQRSDPKSGDPGDWPYGHGPQGDVIRIYNYVRCVRDAGSTDIEENDDQNTPDKFGLIENYPNPFNPTTTIRFSLETHGDVSLQIYDITGRLVETVVNGTIRGEHEVVWDASGYPSGVYLIRLSHGDRTHTRKMLLLK
jgi:hypothetical protein